MNLTLAISSYTQIFGFKILFTKHKQVQPIPCKPKTNLHKTLAKQAQHNKR